MVPTPAQILPIVEGALSPLRDALRRGIEYADDLQPDPLARDPFFWSHSARFKAGRDLMGKPPGDNWRLRPRVPNSGIHLQFDGIHLMRVLRSLRGTTPHPGPNARRQQAWTFLEPALSGPYGPVALELIADWQVADGEPVLHLGLPASPWRYGEPVKLHWRVPFPGDGEAEDWTRLTFNPGGDDSGYDLVALQIDPAEIGKTQA